MIESIRRKVRRVVDYGRAIGHLSRRREACDECVLGWRDRHHCPLHEFQHDLIIEHGAEIYWEYVAWQRRRHLPAILRLDQRLKDQARAQARQEGK